MLHDYSPANSDENRAWYLDEASLPPMDEEARAVLFTLGNGLMEVNGCGPLDPPASGWTMHGRVYAEAVPQSYYFPAPGSTARSPEFPTDRDCMRHTTPVLVVLPNLFGVRMRFSGRRVQLPLTSHRALDMQRGVLESRCEVVIPEGELELRSTRIVVPDEQNLALERLEIRSDRAGVLELTLLADASRVAGYTKYEVRRSREGAVAGEKLVQWSCEGEGTGHRASLALTASGPGETQAFADENGAGITFRVEVEAGEPVVFERFASMLAYWLADDPAKRTAEVASTAANKGFTHWLAATEKSWADFWEEQDIKIEGPVDDQLSIRYAVFQLHCATPPTHLLSFGAKFLSGEGYRDCAFWDTDVFIIPYFSRTQPEVAQRHGLFRHNGLAAAKAKAIEQGYKGARYPWEALPDGEEALGPWVIFNITQVHVVADVAWSIMDYYAWSNDEAFMRKEGAEVLAETARFWASRATKTARGFELLQTCGPNECHEVVNNNVYTNLLAQDNLRCAAQWNPDASDRAKWLEIAGGLVISRPTADGLLEPCDGFFGLKEFMRGDAIPKRFLDYQVSKQADVLMLPMVKPGFLTKEQVEANYRYYEPRTLHWSSLSEATHSQVAARVGMDDDAYTMFRKNMLTDLADRQKSARAGLHAAALGMVPRNVMEGFAGLRLAENGPVVEPRLPKEWRSVSFRFSYAGRRYRCHVNSADNGKIIQPELL